MKYMKSAVPADTLDVASRILNFPVLFLRIHAEGVPGDRGAVSLECHSDFNQKRLQCAKRGRYSCASFCCRQ